MSHRRNKFQPLHLNPSRLFLVGVGGWPPPLPSLLRVFPSPQIRPSPLSRPTWPNIMSSLAEPLEVPTISGTTVGTITWSGLTTLLIFRGTVAIATKFWHCHREGKDMSGSIFMKREKRVIKRLWQELFCHILSILLLKIRLFEEQNSTVKRSVDKMWQHRLTMSISSYNSLPSFYEYAPRGRQSRIIS